MIAMNRRETSERSTQRAKFRMTVSGMFHREDANRSFSKQVVRVSIVPVVAMVVGS